MRGSVEPFAVDPVESFLSPRRERFVEPGISRLVVSDQRVEPLMRCLVVNDELFHRAACDEDERRILDAFVDEVGNDHERERLPWVVPERLRLATQSSW